MRVAPILTAISVAVLISGCDRETDASISEPFVPAMDVGGAESSTLTMYYWDNGWVRLGAIDGGFLPADLRIGINAHNWGPDYPGFWAEFDDIVAYGDIDLPPGVIEDFDGGPDPTIWQVGNPGWWDFSSDVAHATIPSGSDNGIYHIASIDTWNTVIHGEFNVQVDFTLDADFHSPTEANAMLCFWDEFYSTGVCATHTSGYYALWRGAAANLPQPRGFLALQEYTTHNTGKLRITRTRAHKGRVVESVSGSGSFTTAAGDWRTFSFTARRHADGTVDGQWERIRRTDGNASETKSRGVVTCFTVVGNEAWIGGIATRGLYSTPPNRVAWRVVDNAAGQSGSPDRISDQYTQGGGTLPAWYCASQYGGPDLHDIEAGNINIRR